MRVLLDTNVLACLLNGVGSAHFESAANSVAKLELSGLSPILVPQVVYELWVVATRPLASNGLAFTPGEASVEIEGLLRRMKVLLDERGVFERWRELVTKHQVAGKPAHDARLVAAMLRHGVTHLLTFNAGDFKRFTGVTAMTPEGIIAGWRPSTPEPRG